MPIPRPFLTCAPLLLLGMLAGCASSDRQSPERMRPARGGFSVLVDGPDHPASARVLADIAAFAQGRGFVRVAPKPGPPEDPITGESLPAAPQRYTLNSLELDASYQPTTHRVTAYLHGGEERNSKFVQTFYRNFDRQYARQYGGDDPISEIGFSENIGREKPVEENGGRGHGIEGSGGGMSGPGAPGGGGAGDVHGGGF